MDEQPLSQSLDTLLDGVSLPIDSPTFSADDKAALQGFIPNATAADVDALVDPNATGSDPDRRRRLAALALAIALYLRPR